MDIVTLPTVAMGYSISDSEKLIRYQNGCANWLEQKPNIICADRSVCLSIYKSIHACVCGLCLQAHVLDGGRALISLVTCMGWVLSTDMRLKVIEALLAPAIAPAVISLLLWINLTLKRSRDSANSKCGPLKGIPSQQ